MVKAGTISNHLTKQEVLHRHSVVIRRLGSGHQVLEWSRRYNDDLMLLLTACILILTAGLVVMSVVQLTGSDTGPAASPIQVVLQLPANSALASLTPVGR